MPGFLKTGLAKIRIHSTTWQLKTIKFVQRLIKSLYLKPIPDAGYGVYDRFFLFAKSNLPNVLISTAKKFFP